MWHHLPFLTFLGPHTRGEDPSSSGPFSVSVRDADKMYDPAKFKRDPIWFSCSWIQNVTGLWHMDPFPSIKGYLILYRRALMKQRQQDAQEMDFQWFSVWLPLSTRLLKAFTESPAIFLFRLSWFPPCHVEIMQVADKLRVCNHANSFELICNVLFLSLH